ncbi:MAG: 3-isopropylmalate dehydrogenase [Pseudomonadota bacterium]|nr:3-isopropylmalate dehydrogenase [Pseudomonadota bacterium]MED5430215.1 3-isopropylmalate dehydrogenase [Pseudomonadota bacterium]
MNEKKNNILLLPGDGVGPEIMAEVVKIIDYFNKQKVFNVDYDFADIGGIALDNHNVPLPDSTLKKASKADAILLGAVGAKKYENNERTLKPEYGLLELRQKLELFVNLRPIFLFDSLINASTLKSDVIKNLDILIVRELISDVYFGEPRGFDSNKDGSYAFNTMKYTEKEVSRISDFAFSIASTRNKKITSVDKANVLEVSQLWRATVDKVAKNYSDVKLQHMYIDNASMQLIKEPKQFDVILTGNLFGDILSDEASMLTGSIGMLPSASLSLENRGLYEPVHGSAPDIAGKGIVNPIAMILSFAMLLEYTFSKKELSELIRISVNKVLNNGIFTKDLSGSEEFVSTGQMGDKVLEEVMRNVK